MAQPCHLYAAKAYRPGTELRWLIESGAVFEGGRVNRWFIPCGNALSLKQGDLALFGPPPHIAVVTGQTDLVLHCGYQLPDAGQAVRIGQLLLQERAGTLSSEEGQELKRHQDEMRPGAVRLPFLQALFSVLEAPISFYQLRGDPHDVLNPDGILKPYLPKANS